MQQHRKKDGNFDVIVPGSEERLNFSCSSVKKKYGMHPLLITLSPNMMTDIGKHNFEHIN